MGRTSQEISAEASAALLALIKEPSSRRSLGILRAFWWLRALVAKLGWFLLWWLVFVFLVSWYVKGSLVQGAVSFLQGMATYGLRVVALVLPEEAAEWMLDAMNSAIMVLVLIGAACVGELWLRWLVKSLGEKWLGDRWASVELWWLMSRPAKNFRARLIGAAVLFGVCIGITTIFALVPPAVPVLWGTVALLETVLIAWGLSQLIWLPRFVRQFSPRLAAAMLGEMREARSRAKSKTRTPVGLAGFGALRRGNKR